MMEKSTTARKCMNVYYLHIINLLHKYIYIPASALNINNSL